MIMAAGKGLALAGLILVGTALGGAQPAGAKELSDKSVGVLMEYAGQIMPEKFRTPDGDVIEVDKKKKAEVMVPLETARQVIQVARLTAIAQTCKLPEEAAANYRALMYVENARKKWSKQQELYLNQLHLFTVMWLTGKVKIVENEGGKDVVIAEGKDVATQTCTEAEQKQVKEQVAAYSKQQAAALDALTAAGGGAKKAEAPAAAKK